MSRRRNRDEVNNPQVKYLSSAQTRRKTEQSADLMIIGFLSFVLALVWQQYGEQMKKQVANIIETGEDWMEIFRQG